jgi:hypothetical protein
LQFSFDTDLDLYEAFYTTYLPDAIEPFLPLLETNCIGNYFFGGGTPSLMRPDTMCAVFQRFPHFREVKSKTFELHPAIWTEEQVDILAEHNFNCCIIGIQSFDENVLQRQSRLHAPFEKVLELVNAIKSRGIYLAVDLIYLMDHVDPDKIFERDLELVGQLESDVISLQLNYDLMTNEEHTEKFFTFILNSPLGNGYHWEHAHAGQLTVDMKKQMKCFRLVKNGISVQTYQDEIFPFVQTLDEAAKVVGFAQASPSVIGFGSYRNPRKNTFSAIRNASSTIGYIEINNNWKPEYYITERLSHDFFDASIDELNRLREIGPPPRGMSIIFNNKAVTTNENYIYRSVQSQVDMSVSWEQMTPQVEQYIAKLKQLFPHWEWHSH